MPAFVMKNTSPDMVIMNYFRGVGHVSYVVTCFDVSDLTTRRVTGQFPSFKKAAKYAARIQTAFPGTEPLIVQLGANQFSAPFYYIFSADGRWKPTARFA